MLFSLIYCFFLMKLLKIQKMSDWNELSSIAGKWKFCRIHWQWILIEQAFLYTVVYRTFLYNPTNLKVPKKAPCSFWNIATMMKLCNQVSFLFHFPGNPRRSRNDGLNASHVFLNVAWYIVYHWHFFNAL